MITDLVFLDGNSIEDIMGCFDSSIGVWYQAKNVDMIALAKLGSLLQVDSYEELSSGFDLVSEPEEQMLFSFPFSLQSRLGNLADSEIDSVSDEWRTIDEFRGGMTKDACVSYLKDVRGFLGSSTEPVYLMVGA